jgi:hypothetical protein
MKKNKIKLSYGLLKNVVELGNYCRQCLAEKENTKNSYNSKDWSNPTWQIHRRLKFNTELLSLFDHIKLFEEASNLGYKFREEPQVMEWYYHGKNKGAASNFHHDAVDGIPSQVSVMLLLEENIGKTHMKIVLNSKSSLFYKIYNILRNNEWIPFRNILYRINNFFILKLCEIKKIEGDKDSFFYFNAGDQLHQAVPVANTKRTIMHLNLTLGNTRLVKEDLDNLDLNSLPCKWLGMITN